MPIKMRGSDVMVMEDPDDERYVCVNIPTDAEMATSLDIDDEVVITVKGKVKGIHASKGEDVYGTPGDVRVEVGEISIDGKNAFESLID